MNFEKALGISNEDGISHLRHLFDLDDDISLAQIKDMVSFIQVSSAKDGILKPVLFDRKLVYELVGYDEVLRERLTKQHYIFKKSTLGEKKYITEIVTNIDYFESQGMAPRTVIDGEGRRWSLS